MVKLKGYGVDKTTAYRIIGKAKKAHSRKECPYRKYEHKWSIWITAFDHKEVSHANIWQALKNAKVKCDE